MSPDAVEVGLLSFWAADKSFCELPMVLVKPAVTHLA